MTDEQQFITELLNPKTQNAAFEQLLSKFQRPIYSHVRNIVLNHDDADDVVQNTFVKVFRHLKDFKGDSKLFSWIYRIATNEALTFLKQKAKGTKMTGEALQNQLVENLKADSYFDGDAVQLKLQNAILQLPDKQKLVFKMRYFDEIKYEDMSEILGTSVGALKASYHHAAKKIEDFMTRGLNP